MEIREYLLTGEEMTKADHYTSEVLQIPSLVLMEKAALAVADRILQDTKGQRRPVQIAVVAGKGNNGADALAAGRLLMDAGYPVSFYTTFEQDAISVNTDSDSQSGEGETSVSGSAAGTFCGSSLEKQLRILAAYGVRTVYLGEGEASAKRLLEHKNPEILIDGIFGTGLSRAITGRIKEYIHAINQIRSECGTKVYAVDMPSGICAATGKILGAAVWADVTVTFAFYKRGQFFYPGCTYCGEVVCRGIGITDLSLKETPEMFTYRPLEGMQADRQRGKITVLPKRRPDGNKGTFGKVLVIAGSKGVSGACTMCTQAAFRSGAGMVQVITQEDNRVILQETVPEAMCKVYSDEEESSVYSALQEGLDWADTVIAGPGMGTGKAAGILLKGVLQWEKPGIRGVILDADAIRLLAAKNLYRELSEAGKRFPVVLTPHPGEASLLLQEAATVLKDPGEGNGILQRFAREQHVILMAKDARTRVFSPEGGPVYLNTTGNDGLATAGSGDVLAGITGGLLAQNMTGFAAACNAAYLHGRLAETYAKENAARSMTATDLIRMMAQ